MATRQKAKGKTNSAPALRSFRGSITPHANAVLRVRRHRRLTQHASRRPATALPGSDLHRLIAPALPGALPHSITSSARARSVGGTVSPSALAVSRLSTGSYLVGACTGMSAGFSPFKMRST
jgi:hypothetical protein